MEKSSRTEITGVPYRHHIDMERVKVEINNHIAVVRLNRPDKMNALDPQMFKDIIETTETVRKDASVRVVVLTGEGPAFCAGLDLESLMQGSELTEDIEKRTHGICNIAQQIVWGWWTAPVPVIAAVHGVAYGAGLQLMMGADVKYVATDTKLCIMEMKWGLVPDFAATQLMRHTVREDVLRELTYSNRVFSGTEAVDLGFATHAMADPLASAMELAKKIADKSPSAIVTAKKLFNDTLQMNLEDGLMEESKAQAALFNSRNQREAVMASMQKRAPKYEDHRP